MTDVLPLSRVQFAVTTYFHFLLVPLTLGLSVLIAVIETLYVKTGDEDYRTMARFWGRLFVINFVIGVVTGFPLEFQFGTNWSRYSSYVGDNLRPAPGHRGHGSLPSEVHLPCRLSFWLEEAVCTDARGGHVDDSLQSDCS